MISVVLPTYNEARSIEAVLVRASEGLRNAGEDYELIVVDDSSPDGTADIAESLAKEIPVRVLRRPGRQGLATAVVDGWKIAKGDVLGVMDADLQHPPEVLPHLASALHNLEVDVAIATRSGPDGGTAADWQWTRRLTSWTARHMAASVLPRTLADMSDPMSGMFLVRARALHGVQLEPTGYKILLEVLGKAHYQLIAEVPFVFQARSLGKSKLGARESLQYLAHLGRLARSTGQLRSWTRYAAVGFTGAAVNVSGLMFLAGRHSLPIEWAWGISVLFALSNNFLWNFLFTYPSIRSRSGESAAGIFNRFLHYADACTTGIVLNGLLTILLCSQGLPLLLASAAGVTFGGAWNLFFNVPAIWRSWDALLRRKCTRVWDDSGKGTVVPSGRAANRSEVTS